MIITLARVADDLGLSGPQVHRLHSGQRDPTLTTMIKVKELTGWSLDAQAEAFERGKWAVQFGEHLSEHYSDERWRHIR